jgi:hypothetical protein
VFSLDCPEQGARDVFTQLTRIAKNLKTKIYDKEKRNFFLNFFKKILHFNKKNISNFFPFWLVLEILFVR